MGTRLPKLEFSVTYLILADMFFHLTILICQMYHNAGMFLVMFTWDKAAG
jgi:hypothetical protein